MVAYLLSCVQRSQAPRLQPTRLLCPGNLPGMDTGLGCHFLLLGNLLDSGIKPESPAWAGGFFTTSATWEALDKNACPQASTVCHCVAAPSLSSIVLNICLPIQQAIYYFNSGINSIVWVYEKFFQPFIHCLTFNLCLVLIFTIRASISTHNTTTTITYIHPLFMTSHHFIYDVKSTISNITSTLCDLTSTVSV